MNTGVFQPNEYEAYTATGYRRNMTVNVLDMGFFVFALSVVSFTIVLPAFLLRLGASAILIALLPSIQIVGFRVPQLVVPFFVEGRSRVMPWVLTLGLVQRLPWMAIAAITFWLAGAHGRLVLVLVIVLLFCANAASGFSYPAWAELIAKTIPSRRWGLFMGLSHTLGNALGVLGGFVVAFVMQSGRFAYPANYAVLFLIASVLLWVSYAFFAMNREPVVEARPPHTDLRTYLGGLGAILRTDRSFTWYLAFQALAFSSVMGIGLFMAYAITAFGLPDSRTGGFVVTSTVATLVTAPLLGILGDRRGHRAIMEISTAAYVAAALLAILATRWEVLYAVFALTAVSISAQMIAFRNIVYELSPPGKRPTYVALASVVPAPFVVGFSLLGGWLAEYSPWTYKAPFALSAALSAAAWLLLVTRVHLRTGPVPGVPDREA